ncbi:M48 family metallopeptidase [Flavobacterium sp.]|jgi:hypothetical protein|uniref:M48 family metallopeptidase n=1 Tax=Flavobacterium sp. TaxID=239 RepID=UPI0037BF6974
MKFFKILFLFIFLFNSYAQDKAMLLDTINSTIFKDELLNFYTEKYNFFNSTLEDNLKDQSKKNSKIIYLEHQKEFLQKIKKGNFISDKRINNYIQKLLFEILDKNNINKKEYRILISNDSEINAYNTGDGTIVVNYGLFTILDSEDELVFVLCHEISHQELQHVKKEVEKFVNLNNSEEIVNKTKEIKSLKYNRSKAAATFLHKLNYTNYSQRRKKEIEADSLGCYYYSYTNRDFKSPISILRKLNDSNKEIDSLSIQDYKTLFETESYKIKNKYFEVEKSLFNRYDYKPVYQIDSLKTHPDCLARIKNIQKILKDQTLKEIKSDEFNNLKKHTYYQNLYNLYLKGDFGICLYESLKRYKMDKSLFYKDLIFLNLIAIQNAKKELTLSKHIPQVDYVYNSSSLNRFISMISNFKNTDLEIIIQKFK